MTPYVVGVFGLTVVQVMAWCLTALRHYLDQCWLTINKMLWHSFQGNVYLNTQYIISQRVFTICIFEIPATWLRICSVACGHAVTEKMSMSIKSFKVSLHRPLGRHQVRTAKQSSKCMHIDNEAFTIGVGRYKSLIVRGIWPPNEEHFSHLLSRGITVTSHKR